MSDLIEGSQKEPEIIIAYGVPGVGKSTFAAGSNNPIFIARVKGIGKLSQDLAQDHAVTGPNLRGCGVDKDLRKAEPYACYQ